MLPTMTDTAVQKYMITIGKITARPTNYKEKFRPQSKSSNQHYLFSYKCKYSRQRKAT
jgi:hypothetical protein